MELYLNQDKKKEKEKEEEALFEGRKSAVLGKLRSGSFLMRMFFSLRLNPCDY